MDLKKHATKEAVKIAENNVEVHYSLELKDGTKIVLDGVESYGQDRIDEELEKVENEIEKLSEEEVVKSLAKLNKEKVGILDIQDEMDSVLEEPKGKVC